MTIQLKVPGIACSAYLTFSPQINSGGFLVQRNSVNTVTKAIKTVNANATVDADTKTKIVNVQSQQSEDKIKEIIAEAGYPAA